MSGITLREGSSSAVAGGGLRSLGTLTLSDSALTANSAISGGGLSNGGNMTLNRVAISGNTAAQFGGGIFNSAFGTLTINDSAITGNSTAPGSNDGGGIFNLSNTSLTLNNTTLSGNSASGDGGGIASSAVALVLNNVTLSSNTADSDGGDNGSGGGLFVDAFTTATARNTLIAGNADLSAGTRHPDCSGPLVSGGYNLVGNSAGCLQLTHRRIGEPTICQQQALLRPQTVGRNGQHEIGRRRRLIGLRRAASSSALKARGGSTADRAPP